MILFRWLRRLVLLWTTSAMLSIPVVAWQQSAMMTRSMMMSRPRQTNPRWTMVVDSSRRGSRLQNNNNNNDEMWSVPKNSLPLLAVSRPSMNVEQARSDHDSIQHTASTEMRKTTTTTVSTPKSLVSSLASMRLSRTIVAAVIIGCVSFQAMFNPSLAYEDSTSDYASETVQQTIQSLKSAYGNTDQTLRVYEDIAAIITEGKGIGGMINYQGVQLDRGYVADEDTSIYNPGLVLLTESEKEQLVDAVIAARKAGLSSTGADEWTMDAELGYQFLREKLDPFHTTELRGYLGILPMYVGFVYLAVVAVQQLARKWFTPAYFVGVAAILLPILVLAAIGP